MTITISHPFVSGKSDGSDATLIQPSNWNAAHTITMATAKILGRATASTGAVEELSSDNVWTMLGIVSGTKMVFKQTAAPTGWTKETTADDAALRVVSGTASSGGTNGFSTVMAQTATGSHALSATEVPNHTHTATSVVTDPGHHHSEDSTQNNGQAASGSGKSIISADTTNTGSSTTGITVATTVDATTGGGGGHTHTMTMAMKYVDVITASKN